MPLGIMAPFMGYQSAALAYNFGLNYEFGKRVIKSMSNEKFNKIAEDPILLNELTSRHHDVLLQAFINEVPKVDKIQDLIIKKMVELEFAKIKVMPELIAQIPKGFIEGLFQLGNTGEQLPNVPQPNPPPSGKGKKSPTPAPPPSAPKPPPKLKVGKSTTKPNLPLVTFIPPIYNSNINVEIQSIARIVANTFQIQQTKGTWTTFKTYNNRTAAFTDMMLSYPSPKYFPVYVGTKIYATRRQ